MNPPTPGLRRLTNRTNAVAKVALVIPSGDTLDVSDTVADQLGNTGAFSETVAAKPAKKKAAAKKA